MNTGVSFRKLQLNLYPPDFHQTQVFKINEACGWYLQEGFEIHPMKIKQREFSSGQEGHVCCMS